MYRTQAEVTVGGASTIGTFEDIEDRGCCSRLERSVHCDEGAGLIKEPTSTGIRSFLAAIASLKALPPSCERRIAAFGM